MEPGLSQLIFFLGLFVTMAASTLRLALLHMDASLIPWRETDEAENLELQKHWFTRSYELVPNSLKRLLAGASVVGWLGVAIGLQGFSGLFSSLGAPGLEYSFLLPIFLFDAVLIPKVFRGRVDQAISWGTLLSPCLRGGLYLLEGRAWRDKENPRKITRETLEYFIERGLDSGVLDKEREKLLASVFDYGETLARGVMVPRTDVVGLAVESDLHDVLEIIENEGFSRYPVYRDSVDEVVGIFVVKDMLPYLRGPRKEPFKLAKFIRPPYYVPETKRISELMREMQGRKLHMALIADEFGGTAGLVTQENIIEEVFGDIFDETDADETPLIQTLDANRFLVDARISLRDFEEFFKLELVSEGDGEYDTLAGFVLATAGRVLGQGETLTMDNLQMVVRDADSTHVRTVEIHCEHVRSDKSDDSSSAPSEQRGQEA